MNPAITSFAARFFGLGLQAAILFAMRLQHPAGEQSKFFAAQTILGLQFLAEFGATQAMLQRMRQERVAATMKPCRSFFGLYAALSSLLFFGIIPIAWRCFYGNTLILSNGVVLTVSTVGALRLMTVFSEAYVEGSGRISEIYQARFAATIISQTVMLVCMLLLTPVLALVCSTLVYVICSNIINRKDVLYFYGGVRFNRLAVNEFFSFLKSTGRFQSTLMISSACGYLIFSGPVILAGRYLDAMRVAEVGTSLLLASVAASLCGSVFAPFAVKITDSVLVGHKVAAWRLELRLIIVTVGLFVAGGCTLKLVELLHLRALPLTSDLVVALGAYFCFTLGLVFAPGLRAMGKDLMLVPSLLAALAFVLLSIGTIRSTPWKLDPLWIFAAVQGVVFLPAVLLIKRAQYRLNLT